MLPTVSLEGIEIPQFEAMSPVAWDQALQEAFDQAERDGHAIATNVQAPSFENTFVAMERRNKALWNIAGAFMATQAPHNTPEMQALAEKWLPRLEEQSTRFLDRHLAQRCQEVIEKHPPQDAVDYRLAQDYLDQFKRAGAFLNEQQRARFLQVRQTLTELGLEFAARHLRNTNALMWVPQTLPGVDEVFAEQARQRAIDAGKPGMAAIALNASEVDTLLVQCSDRSIREVVFKRFAARGTGADDADISTQDLLQQILSLRQEQAELLGFSSWADYATQSRMAKTGQAAKDMVLNTWTALAPILARDLAQVAQYAVEHGHQGDLQPWDIDYWLNRVRSAHYAVNEDELREYLPLPVVRGAAFATAEALFGVSFERADLPTYHPDATPFLVRNHDGQALGVLYIDDAIRDTKGSGAWMDQVRGRNHLDSLQKPVVLNVCNFPAATAQRPALLSFDEAITVFHELGHALHGLLTTARYPSQSGTSVYRDFVELQSQLLENWFRHPQALSQIARHWETGEKLGEEKAQQVARAMQFGASVDKARYLLSAWIDLAAHEAPHVAGQDAKSFEAGVLAGLGVSGSVAPRHRLNHFTHLFDSAMSDYAAGYYAYLWAEVLEADAFEMFEEQGELYHPQLGQHLRNTLYARGNEVDPSELYREFRGRDADPAALLKRMGAQAPSRAPRP